MRYVELDIPRPISTNRLYRSNNGKRHKTREYREFISKGCNMLANSSLSSVTGFVYVDVYVPKFNNIRSDIDNTLKSSLDLLVTSGIIGDDSQVMGVYGQWVLCDKTIPRGISKVIVYYDVLSLNELTGINTIRSSYLKLGSTIFTGGRFVW